MMIQEFWDRGAQFFNVCTIYYVVQLTRCVLFSFVLFAFVFFLRKTALKNRIFLKGLLWSLFIPVLFIGKMRFFYENGIGIKLFSWQTAVCMNHIWICRLYICSMFVYAVLLFCRRRKLKKMVSNMEKRKIEDTFIYVADIPVTPSTIGVFKPKIVMPEVILKEYDRKEIQTILLHEKTHIRLGHLLFYLLWDILRVLLWLNPFLVTGIKYFREDMEDICDLITIRRSDDNAYDYGKLLLKSMRFLQTESKDFNMYAAFAGNNEYRNIRQRIIRISQYKPYKQITAAGTLISAILCVVCAVFWIQSISYSRCTSNDNIVVYDMETGIEFVSEKEALKQAVCYDENYIYIKSKTLQELISDSKIQGRNIHIYFGGYYKLPWIGGGGNLGYLETAESKENVIKIEYKKQEDIFDYILRLL